MMHGFVLRRERLYMPISYPVRILHIGDVHSSFHPDAVREIRRIMREEQPHAVCVSGDAFDRSDRRPVWEIRGVFPRLPKGVQGFFVTGNHEATRSDATQVKDAVRAQGYHVLDRLCGGVEAFGLHFYGIDDPAWNEEDHCYAVEDFTRALESVPRGKSVLLAHRPERIGAYAKAGFSLVLSGHAHGGQIRWKGKGFFAPGQGFFPKYTRGFYRVQNTVLHVTSGATGRTMWVPRWGNPAEIALLTLQPERA